MTQVNCVEAQKEGWKKANRMVLRFDDWFTAVLVVPDFVMLRLNISPLNMRTLSRILKKCF